MTFIRLFEFHNIRKQILHLAFALFLLGIPARAQTVTLHLRNGDRITGAIVSENTNQVVMSNTWSRELIIPLAQIERREITATNLAIVSTNGVVATTNSVIVSTNAMAIASTNALARGSATNLTVQAKPVSWLRDTNTFWGRWKGEISIGTDYERGALNHELYYGRAKFTYAQPYKSDPKEFFRNILSYDAEYGKTDGTLTDNRMGGSSKTDFDVNRTFYVYNLGTGSHDEVQKINLHYEDGPGMGYHWINHTNLAVNLELGANYQVEDRSDGSHTHSAYYRLGEDLTWKPSKQFSFTQKFEYFPRVAYASQYRMRFESTLSYALLLNISLNLNVVDLYDTQPVAGIPNNDFQFHTSVGIKF